MKAYGILTINSSIDHDLDFSLCRASMLMESLYLLERLGGQEAVLQKQKISAFLLIVQLVVLNRRAFHQAR